MGHERIYSKLGIPGLTAIPGQVMRTQDLINLTSSELHSIWQNITQELKSETLIVKPRADGCSTGVAHLFSSFDLVTYCEALKNNFTSLLPHSLTRQENTIEMPPLTPAELVFERFVATDHIRVVKNKLHHTKKTGWIEITLGVIEAEGSLKALNPSITLAEGEVLSVEEKFQGGTGINITPPPPSIMKSDVLKRVQERITQLAQAIGITGYSRIDAFVHVATGAVQIIEINTLPGLTPSTVLYQQALAQTPPLFPRTLLELLIANKGY